MVKKFVEISSSLERFMKILINLMIINLSYLQNSYKPSAVDDDDDDDEDTVELVTRDALLQNDEIEILDENENIQDEENIDEDMLPYEDSEVDSNMEINREHDEINEPLLVSSYGRIRKMNTPVDYEDL